MNEVPDVPPAPADARVRAPASGPVEPEEAAPESRLAFDGALAEEGGLYDSQTPETREAIGKSLTRFQSASAPRPSGGEQTGPREQTESEPGGASSPAPRASGHVPEPRDTTRLAAGGAREGSSAAPTGPVVAERQLPAPPPRGAPRRAFEADMPAPHGAANPATGKETEREPGPREANHASRTPDPRPEAARTTARARSASPDTEHVQVGSRTASTDTRESLHIPTATNLHSMPVTGTDAHHETEPTANRTPATPSRNPEPTPPEAKSPGPTHGRNEAGRSEHPESRDAPDPGVVERTDLTGSVTPVSVPETQATTAPATVQAPSTEAVEIAREVTDRILVSAPKPGAPDEVRISLNASVLDGSDIRIFREAGELKVVFVTQTESAQRFLADHRAVFQQTLGERLQDERVHVEVSTGGREGASREDAEGRSRQRYVPQDDSSALT